MLSRRSLALTLMLGMVAAAGGCGSPSVDNPNIQKDPPAAHPAVVNLIHASPDAPSVDVYFDGKKTISAVDYRKSSGNVMVAPGSHKVEIRPAGAADSDMPVWSNYVVLQSDQKVLLTAVGRVAETSGATKFNLVAQRLGISDPAQVQLRLLHASPGAPSLDVAIGDNVLLSGASFGSATAYGAVKGDLAGTVTLSLRSTGDTEVLAGLKLPGPIKAGSVVTAIALGEIDPLSSDAKFLRVTLFDEATGMLTDVPLTINDQGTHSTLYVFHAAPDAPAVDIFAKNGARLIGGLAYQKASPLLDLMPGAYQIDVKPAGMSAVVTSASVKLLPGLNWVVYAVGFATKTGAQGLAIRSAPRAVKGASSLYRAVHAVPDAATFDLKNNGPTLFARLTYPLASPYRSDDLPVGKLQLLLGTKSWDVVVPQMVADNAAGEVTSLFVTGSSTIPGSPLGVVAVIESSATTMQAPTVVSLMTTVTPP